jgi:uncharacterized membrane protein YdjX (TVP38/TMEM64 family)
MPISLNNKQKKQIWLTDLLIIFIFLVVIIIFAIWNPTLPTRSVVDEWVSQWGINGPLALILTIIIETVIAPLPGILISITAGALYGIWPGILYLWIGNMIGSNLSYWIARKLGRPIVKKIIPERTILVYDDFLSRNKLLIWLVYIMPIFPVDIIGYVLGLSAVPYKHYLKIITIGFAVNLFILTAFGDQLLTASGNMKLVYVLGIMLLLIFAVTIEKILKATAH